MSVAGIRARLHAAAPTALVMLIAGFGLVRVVMEHWRQGAVIIGAALLVAAVLRALLPAERIELLAVRSKVLDVLFYSVFGLAMILLAVTITRGALALS